MRWRLVVVLTVILVLLPSTPVYAGGGRTLVASLQDTYTKSPQWVYAEVTLSRGQKQVCFVMNAVIAADRIAGPAGVIDLNGYMGSGCVYDVDRKLIGDILKNPTDYWFYAETLEGMLNRDFK